MIGVVKLLANAAVRFQQSQSAAANVKLALAHHPATYDRKPLPKGSLPIEGAFRTCYQPPLGTMVVVVVVVVEHE
jgi:hypothetical protein